MASRQELHDKLRTADVNVDLGAGKRTKITFQRLWWEPLAWALCQFPWSHRYKGDDSVPTQRARTISFLELACITDILTGGCFGPADTSLVEKAALVKYGVMRLLKVATLHGPEGEDKAIRYMAAQSKVPSCEPCGLPNLSGLDRRPALGSDAKLIKALGTMI